MTIIKKTTDQLLEIIPIKRLLMYAEPQVLLKRLLSLGIQKDRFPEHPVCSNRHPSVRGELRNDRPLMVSKLFPFTKKIAVFIIAALFAGSVFSETPWWNTEWNFRTPLIIRNNSDKDMTEETLFLKGFNCVMLVNAGKLRKDGRDLRIIDDAGKELYRSVENFLNDNNEDRIWFKLDFLKAKSERTFYIYYGNPNAGKPPAKWDESQMTINRITADDSTVLLYNFDADEQTKVTNSSPSGEQYDASLRINAKDEKPQWTKMGKYGGGLDFDGRKTYMNIPVEPGIEWFKKPFTVECWARPGVDYNSQGYGGILLTRGLAGSYLTLAFASSINFSLNGAPSPKRLSAKGDWEAGEWYHIAVTFTGEKFYMFVNGEIEDSCTFNPKEEDIYLPEDISYFTIGCEPNLKRFYFNGTIDSFKIHKCAVMEFPYLVKPAQFLIGREETKPGFEPPVAKLVGDEWFASHVLIEAEDFDGLNLGSAYTKWYSWSEATEGMRTASRGTMVATSGVYEGSQILQEWIEKEIQIPDNGTYKFWVRYHTYGHWGADDVSFHLKVEQGINEKIIEMGTKPMISTGFCWEGAEINCKKGKAYLGLGQKGRPVIDCVLVTADTDYIPDFRDFGSLWFRYKLLYPKVDKYVASFDYMTHTYNIWYKTLGFMSRMGVTEFFPVRDKWMENDEWSHWVKFPTVNPSHGSGKWNGSINFRKDKITNRYGENQWRINNFNDKFISAVLAKLTGIAVVRTEGANGEFLIVEGDSESIEKLESVFSFDNGVKVALELSTRRDESGTFHRTVEDVKDAYVSIILPRSTEKEPLKKIFTATEYARMRVKKFESAGIKKGVPPKYVTVTTHMGVGKTPEHFDSEMKIASGCGVNSVTAHTTENVYRSITEKYGIKKSMDYDRIDYMFYSGLDVKWLETDDIYSYYTRILDVMYKRDAEKMKKENPTKFSHLEFLDMGDEIGGITNPAGINASDTMLVEFRKYLKERNLSPEYFKKTDYMQVKAADGIDTAKASNSLYEKRLYYHTQRFISYLTARIYGIGTQLIEQYYGKHVLTCVNFQAAPMISGCMWGGQLDIYECGRERTFSLLWTEDWMGGNELGLGGIGYGLDLMRTAGSYHNLPLGGYDIVGCGKVRDRGYMWAGHGSKFISLYLYGPVTHTNDPSWEDDTPTQTAIADFCYEVGKADDLLYFGKPRKNDVAILYSTSQDIWDTSGLCARERRSVYIALQHRNAPADIISEYEIKNGKLKNYKLLYIVDINIERDVQEEIKKWVAGGGILWASAGAGTRDEYDQPSNELYEVFGVTKHAVYPLTKIATKEEGGGFKTNWSIVPVTRVIFNSAGPVKIPQTTDTMGVYCNVMGFCALITPKKGAVVFGQYNNEDPAAVFNKFGKGGAYLVGCLPGSDYVNERWDLIVQRGEAEKRKKEKPSKFKKEEKKPELMKLKAPYEDAGKWQREIVCLPAGKVIRKPVELSKECVYTNLLESEKGIVVMLINTGDSIPMMTAKINGAGKFSAVESAVSGAVKYREEQDAVVVDMPLENCDFLIIRR